MVLVAPGLRCKWEAHSLLASPLAIRYITDLCGVDGKMGLLFVGGVWHAEEEVPLPPFRLKACTWKKITL